MGGGTPPSSSPTSQLLPNVGSPVTIEYMITIKLVEAASSRFSLKALTCEERLCQYLLEYRIRDNLMKSHEILQQLVKVDAECFL